VFHKSSKNVKKTNSDNKERTKILKKFFRLTKGNQKGFTLIELLVVIGILGVLGGVAVPAYSKFFGSGKTEANVTELGSVQSAMDAMMADKQAPDVAASAAATDVFTALPVVGASTVPVAPLQPVYMRSGATRCTYSWDTTGKVTQTVGVGGACR